MQQSRISNTLIEQSPLGFLNFEATEISKASLENEKALPFTLKACLGLEATVGVGDLLDLSQPQDSHVYAFPPLRYNPTHFVVTQIVNEDWFCSTTAMHF